MVTLIRRRSMIAIASVALLVVLVAAGLAGWLSSRSKAAATSPHSGATPAAALTQAAQAPGAPAVLLAAQDLTPATKLRVSVSGFQPKEPLALSIADAQGNTYLETTLDAAADGRLHEASVALPPALGTGEYQLVVLGSNSHRKASVAFRMHDIPPAVTLDAYTAKAGQSVGFAGDGFFAGETVNVMLGQSSAPLMSVKATDRGAVAGHLMVPALAAGTYTLTLAGTASQMPATVGFSIQNFSAWVVLQHYAPKVGEGVGIIGHGFGPGEQVFIYVNAVKGDPALRVTTDPDGGFVVQDTWVPSGNSGKNTLTFVGQSSQATATADFTVIPGAEPTTAPTTP